MLDQSLKQKTKKGLYWKLFDQTANQGIQFIVGIVMARLLTPEDFGITALPAVFLAIVGVFLDSGFSVALIRKPDLTEKDLSTSFYYSLLVGVFMYLCLFFTAPLIASFYSTPILTDLVRATALTFLWGPLITPQTVILTRNLDFKTPARISIINKLVAGAISIFAAYRGLGLWSLVIYGLISSFVGLIQTWIAVKWIPRVGFDKQSFNYLWNYGNKIIGAKLIDIVYSNITPIIVGKVYNTYTLGIYDRANGYAKLPANQIGNLLMSVTLPVLSKMQDNKEALKRNYRRMISVSAFISFPIFMLLCALAKPFIILLITNKWEDSIVLLQILCFGLVWWPIHSINTNLLQVVGRSDLYLRVEIVKKTFMIAILCASIPFGIRFFCIGIVLQNIVALIVNCHYTKKIINYGIISQLSDIWRSIICSLLTLFIVLAVIQLFNNEIIQILVGGSIGLVCYCSIAYFFNFSEIKEVKGLLSK